MLNIFSVYILSFVVVVTTLLFCCNNSYGFVGDNNVLVPPRRYLCESAGYCRKVVAAAPPLQGNYSEHGQALDVCVLTCGNGSLWPLPTGNYTLSKRVRQFSGFDFVNIDAPPEAKAQLVAQLEIFSAKAAKLGVDVGNVNAKKSQTGENSSLLLKISIKHPRANALLLTTDESYQLEISEENGVSISAPTYYGARHGLETLNQLMARDVLQNKQYIVSTAFIEDHPLFAYRGVMLDVSRNYLPVPIIKSIINSMGMSKLNTLHLHLSDTASFPVHIPSRPNVTAHGAYSQEMSYSVSDLQNLSKFANLHGVRLVPEIDVPAHSGAGYQWTAAALLGEVVVCDQKQAEWGVTALEPPSGQLDPTNENTYSILADIYDDLAAIFVNNSLFHLGGDEVIVGCEDRTCWPEAGCSSCFAACWNSTEYAPSITSYIEKKRLDITDPLTFYGLWKNFTIRARGLVNDSFNKRNGHNYDFEKLSKVQSGTIKLEKMLQWAGTPTADSTVTYNLMGQQDLEQVLPVDDFVLEVWDLLNDSIAPSLMKKGYDVVLAHTDYVYLDCGQSGWVGPGGYWCQPYHEWYRIYQYLPDARRLWGLTLDPADTNNHVIGSEVLAWGEEIDAANVEQKLWPRAAALAERFWSDPEPSHEYGWIHADYRMQIHRNRLVKSGSSAAALQPHWCLQNGGICTLHPNTHFNGISTIYKTAGVARQQTVDVTDMLYETDVAGAQRQ